MHFLLDFKSSWFCASVPNWFPFPNVVDFLWKTLWRHLFLIPIFQRWFWWITFIACIYYVWFNFQTISSSWGGMHTSHASMLRENVEYDFQYFVLCLTDCKQSPWTSLRMFISWHRTLVYMICKPAIMLINIINILLKKFHNNARLYVLWLLNNPDLAVRLCVWVFAMILILSVHEKEKRFIQNFCQVNLIGGICWFLVCWTCSSS